MCDRPVEMKELDQLVLASAELDAAERAGSDTLDSEFTRQTKLRVVRSTLTALAVERVDDIFEAYDPVKPAAFGDGYGRAVADEVHGGMLARREPDNEQGLTLLLRSGASLRTLKAYRHGAAVYRKAMIRATELALDREAADAYVAKTLCTEEGLRQRNRPQWLLYAVWRLSSKYGQSWLRWCFWVLAAILLFGLVYLPTPQMAPWDGSLVIAAPYDPAQDCFNAFFASVIALGLPGLGGVSPGNDLTKLVLVLNGLTGFFLVGVLATLLTQRLLNRH